MEQGAAMRSLVIERNGQRLSFQVPGGMIGIEISSRLVPAELMRTSPQESRGEAIP